MSEKRTFQDRGEHWLTFARHSLVECPRCEAQATVDCREASQNWRLVCPACALTREATVHSAGAMTRVCDPAFECKLWLQTPCCGETLWAFGPAHLSFIENYIGADLRKGMPLDQEPGEIRNATVASRLPRWMIQSHHRDDVLLGVARLRARLLQLR